MIINTVISSGSVRCADYLPHSPHHAPGGQADPRHHDSGGDKLYKKRNSGAEYVVQGSFVRPGSTHR